MKNLVATALAKVVAGHSLAADEMAEVVHAIVDASGTATPAQVGALLVALRMKGETVDEVVGAATAMRAHAVRPPALGEELLVDTCGTGGDGRGTVNVSTLAGLVAAAGGLRVAKHGNRALSSRAGSADLIEALGIDPSPHPEATARALDTHNFGFFFAPRYHPATGRVADVRRQLGVRTIFNWLGPLTNPARVRHQVIGVYSAELLRPMAEVLRRLGSARALVVHGHGGLDEIAPDGPTEVVELDGEKIVRRTISPADFELTLAGPSDLEGGDPQENGRRAEAILSGVEMGWARAAVVLSAGAAYYVAGRGSLADGAAWATATLDDALALTLIERLRDDLPLKSPDTKAAP